jgi:beta-glucosidase
MSPSRAILTVLAATTVVVSGQIYGNGSNANAPYKDPNVSVDDRIADLLSRMTIKDKAAQLMQGDITNWMNATSNAFNQSGLVASMEWKQGSFYVGYPVPQSWIAENTKRAQDYLVNETPLGIPAFVQSEGIHGFLIGNATIFNSPIAFASSFNLDLIEKMAQVIAKESLYLGGETGIKLCSQMPVDFYPQSISCSHQWLIWRGNCVSGALKRHSERIITSQVR